MKEESAPTVGSQIAGIVYTDLVVYILPGALLLLGILATILTTYQAWGDVGQWIQGKDFLGAVLVAAAAAGMSYVTGIVLSMVRWYLYDPLQGRLNPMSLGRLIYGNMPPSTRRVVGLPQPMRQRARIQIEKNLRDLKWLDNGALEEVDDERTGGHLKKLRVDADSRLMDCFFSAILESARASHAPIFSYYQRWGDVAALRQNLVIAIQLFLLFATPIAIVRSEFPIWTAAPAIALVVTLGWFYIYILPMRRYSGMRYVLIAYLAGEIRVPSDATVTSSKVPSND